MVSDNWKHRARCRPGNPHGIDPELFFPYGTISAPARDQIRRAKMECDHCPVLSQCRNWILKTNYPSYGVCGGWDDDEIVAIKRQLVCHINVDDLSDNSYLLDV